MASEKRLQVRTPGPLLRALESASERTGLTIPEIIRTAVAVYLDVYRDPRPEPRSVSNTLPATEPRPGTGRIPATPNTGQRPLVGAK
jgi:hypothetical protein